MGGAQAVWARTVFFAKQRYRNLAKPQSRLITGMTGSTGVQVHPCSRTW